MEKRSLREPADSSSPIAFSAGSLLSTVEDMVKWDTAFRVKNYYKSQHQPNLDSDANQ